MGIEDEVGGMSVGVPDPGGRTQVLAAHEINDICERVFNQSADLYDLRIFDFAREIETLVSKRVKAQMRKSKHHQASAVAAHVEEI
jgi:hypothetical protein